LTRYVYAFFVESDGSSAQIHFPKLPEIFASVPPHKNYRDKESSSSDIQECAGDALLTGLQARIVAKLDIPAPDNQDLKAADGFIMLTVQQSMKLELFKLYKENCRSVLELARKINKQETAARRLLNLRHPSQPLEVEAAVEVFGKRIVHCWNIEPATKSGFSARPAPASLQPE
jgi:hypothetical protein